MWEALVTFLVIALGWGLLSVLLGFVIGRIFGLDDRP